MREREIMRERERFLPSNYIILSGGKSAKKLEKSWKFIE